MSKGTQVAEKVYSLGSWGGLGTLVAIIISVAFNHSFWWALLHFLFGWFYVYYAIIWRAKEIIPAVRALFGV